MFSSSEDLTKRYYYQTNSKKLQTLCVYGDSMGVHYHKLAKSRPLCKEMFLECNNKYMWIYDVSFKTYGRQVNVIIMKATFRAGIILLDCVYALNQSVHNLSSLTAWRVLGRSRIHPGPDK